MCEIIYILTILLIGSALGGKIYLTILEFLMFILNSLLVIITYTANCSKYITNSYWEDGKQYIISQELNPNYPGDEKVEFAKTIYLTILQGQASKIANMDTEVIYKIPIYSIILISIINIGGMYLFSKKELK